MRRKANKETLVANINIFVQQSTSKWRRRLAKSQLGIGDKDRRQRKSYLFVLPPLHCSGYTPCVQNPYGINKQESFCKSGPKKNNTNIQICEIQEFSKYRFLFSACFKTNSAQIPMLAGACFCGIFDFIVESNLWWP